MKEFLKTLNCSASECNIYMLICVYSENFMYFVKDCKSLFSADFNCRNEFIEELNEAESNYKHKYVTLHSPVDTGYLTEIASA